MFTPGPWHAERDGAVRASSGETVCAEANPANARLVAVAPEMFELLVAVLYGRMTSDYKKAIARIEAQVAGIQTASLVGGGKAL